MHTVHEIAAARRWAWEQGVQRELWFERVEGLKEDKDGNMVKVIEWAAELFHPSVNYFCPSVNYLMPP